MKELMRNAIFWVKGFESIPMGNFYGLKEHSHIPHVLQCHLKGQIDFYFLESIIYDFLYNNFKTEEIIDGKVVDIYVRGERMRIIIGGVSPSLIDGFLLDIPDSTPIIFLGRPINYTKERLEEIFTAQGKLFVDFTVPKPKNLFKLAEKKEKWSLECVLRNAFEIILKALFDSIISSVFKNLF